MLFLQQPHSWGLTWILEAFQAFKIKRWLRFLRMTRISYTPMKLLSFIVSVFAQVSLFLALWRLRRAWCFLKWPYCRLVVSNSSFVNSLTRQTATNSRHWYQVIWAEISGNLDDSVCNNFNKFKDCQFSNSRRASHLEMISGSWLAFH